jgi:hypothetical protein
MSDTASTVAIVPGRPIPWELKQAAYEEGRRARTEKIGPIIKAFHTRQRKKLEAAGVDMMDPDAIAEAMRNMVEDEPD